MPDEEEEYESAFSLDGLSEDAHDESESESDRELRDSESDYTPGEGTWVGLALFWIFTLIWCAASAFATVMIGGAIAADLGTGDWTPVDGIITDSGVHKSYDSEGGESWCLWVEYEYTYDNRNYEGSTISYSKQDNCNSWSSQADEEYPPGKNVTVYVDPENPADAVLEPGWSGIDFFMCCFCLFPLVGILLFTACCVATYNSIMNPDKYIVGNFVPGDTSDSVDESPKHEGQLHPGVDLGDNFSDVVGKESSFGGRFSIEQLAISDTGSLVGTVVALVVINLFAGVIILESLDPYENQASPFGVEGSEDWPTTTGWFSENFTYWYDDEIGDEFFSGSIIIYCSATTESNFTQWVCGENNSVNERIEIPIKCTPTEEIAPWSNPCEGDNKYFVLESYFWHDHDWHGSESCKWEGHSPENSDNLWICYADYDGDGIANEFDSWWYYCEYDDNETSEDGETWYCTDKFGEDISSPNNRNGTLFPGSPTERPTEVNYDPGSTSRIVLMESYNVEMEMGGDGFFNEFFLIMAIIDLVLIVRVGATIYLKTQSQ